MRRHLVVATAAATALLAATMLNPPAPASATSRSGGFAPLNRPGPALRVPKAELAGVVPPTVFIPEPAVDSALVRLVRRAEPPGGTLSCYVERFPARRNTFFDGRSGPMRGSARR